MFGDWNTTTRRESNRLVTDATTEVVTEAEAKAHCRVLHTDEDTTFTLFCKTARRWVERATNRTLITSTRRLTLDCFPCEVIYLRYPPVINVSSVVYIATDGTSTTLSTDAWLADYQAEPGRLTPAYGYTWPSTQDRTGAVTVTYTAGYGAAATAVPIELKQAILLKVGQLWNARAGEVDKYADQAIDSLIAPYVLAEYA